MKTYLKCAHRLGLAAAWLAAAAIPTIAQVSFTGSYSQDFNTLPSSGTPTWSNNTTLAGWYAYGSGIAGTNATRDGGTVNPLLTVDTGTSTSGGLHSYGSAALPGDRALGSIGSGGTAAGDITFALVLQNTGSQTYDGFTLAFTGEQWRNGGNTTQHKLDGDFIVVSTFTPTTTIPANVVAGYTNPTDIDFTGPVATVTAAALDGNNSNNRVLFNTSQTATWAPGQYLIVRWWDDNDTGNDHGLAIDDLTLTGLVTCTGPAISDDPDAAQVCNGSSAMFSVTATGTAPLTYQWRKNGMDIGGATSSSYTIASAASGDAGNYDCVVTNACGMATSMAATLMVQASATADAGLDLTICDTDVASLSGSAANASNTLWSTSGDGSFANASVLSTTYMPGSGDLSAGTVTLTLTADDTSPCVNFTADSLTLSITASPTASAGDDQSICETEAVSLSGSTTGAASVLWTTSGDGTFADASMASTTYTPGSGDLTAGSVTLTLSADPVSPCATGASDSLDVTITAGPTANAGMDQGVCSGDTVSLAGTASNQSGVTWTTSGDGSFDDAGSLIAVYTPGSGDLSAGSVDLTLTSIAVSPCTGNATDTLTITLSAGPTVDAGVDQSVCSGGDINVSASIMNGASSTWSTSGDGTFADAAAASTSYTPGPGDLTAGSVTLTISADANAPCTGSASDSLTVTFATGPSVEAGSDYSICSGDTAPLSATAANSSNLMWTTSGDGLFADATAASTTYTPGPTDISGGSVVLTVSVDANAPCTGTASDTITITIAAGPTVNAGMDQTVCAGDTVTLSGSVSAGMNAMWTTSGDGTFADASSASTTYTPGAGDLMAGTVTLTLAVDATAPCIGSTADSLVVTLTAGPTVNAGMDQSTCASDMVSLSGSVTNGSNVLWTTSGDGSFADAGSAATTYTPGSNDMLSGSVTLTLTADAIAPCTGSASDSLTVTLGATTSISAQPMDASVFVGQSASFTVTASGSGTLTYQWRKDGSDLSDGPRIMGATTAMLSINPTELGDAGSYDCVISGTCGMVTSDAADLQFLAGCPNSQPGCTNSDIYPAASPDCVVDLSDLGVILANFAPGTPGKTRAQGDIWPLGGTGDGFVDLSDLGQVLADFGTDCR